MIDVITLRQPYATAIFTKRILIDEFLKNIETRSWNTKFRGRIYIHAALGKTKDQRKLFDKYSKYFEDSAPTFDDLPFGKIIGSVNIIETLSTDYRREPGAGGIFIERHGTQYNWKFSKIGNDFGDYSKNRYMWLLSDPQVIEPIPAKGQLSIWKFRIGKTINSIYPLNELLK